MWRYRCFFALLYFVQGAALAYIINFQKPYLVQNGISKEVIGLFTALLLIPFILKVFLGLLSDRVPLGPWGSRKPYMVIGLCLFAASYMGMSQVNPALGFLQFAILAWLGALGLAIFDTCADGWAIDIADLHEQSSLQAAMISGKSMGLILMSFGFGMIADSHGFAFVFQFLAGFSLLVLVAVICMPHQPVSVVRTHLLNNWRDLLAPFYLRFALYGVLYSVASFGVDGLLTLHLTEVHHALNRELGMYGVSRGLGSLSGAGLYVYCYRRWGLAAAQYIALLGLGLGCLLAIFNLPFLGTGYLWGVAWGFQETAYVTLAMRFAQGSWAASFFAVSMIFSNLGTSLGEALAAPAVPKLGYTAVFIGLALLAWTCVLLVPKMMVGPNVNRSVG